MATPAPTGRQNGTQEPSLPRYAGQPGDTLHIALSTATGKDPKHWRNRRTTWAEFVETWTTHISDKKECGGWVAGRLRLEAEECSDDCTRVHRRKDTVLFRSLITLDADAVDDDFLDRLVGMGWAGLVHTSYSHGLPDKGNRYRVILRVSRAMTPSEYRAVCLWVVFRLGGFANWKDWGTWQHERFMHRPSAPEGEGFQWWLLDGDLIDVDKAVLAAPPPPKRRRKRGSVPVGPYEGREYPDLEPVQQAAADADLERSLTWARDAMEAYLAGDGEAPFEADNEGWDEQFKALAFFLGCLAVCPWNAFAEDDAKEFYEVLVDVAGESNNPRFADKIEYEPLWDKVAAEPVDLPPWERNDEARFAGVTAAEAFGPPLDGAGSAPTQHRSEGPLSHGQADRLLVGLLRPVLRSEGRERWRTLRWAARKAAKAVPRGLDASRAIDTLVAAGMKQGLTEERARSAVGPAFRINDDKDED